MKGEGQTVNIKLMSKVQEEFLFVDHQTKQSYSSTNAGASFSAARATFVIEGSTFSWSLRYGAAIAAFSRDENAGVPIPVAGSHPSVQL